MDVFDDFFIGGPDFRELNDKETICGLFFYNVCVFVFCCNVMAYYIITNNTNQ